MNHCEIARYKILSLFLYIGIGSDGAMLWHLPKEGIIIRNMENLQIQHKEALPPGRLVGATPLPGSNPAPTHSPDTSAQSLRSQPDGVDLHQSRGRAN